MSKTTSWETLLTSWQQAGWMTPDNVATVRNALGESGEEPTPWYIRLLVGLSAWLAAVLFIVFLVLIDVVNEAEHFVLIGLVLIGIGIALSYRPPQVFVDQLGLAASITGQASFIGGMADYFDSTLWTWSILVILQLVMIIVYDDAVQRLLSTIVALFALLGVAEETLPALAQGITVLATVILVLGWSKEAAWFAGPQEEHRRPIGYGAAIGLLCVLIFSLQPDWFAAGPWWVSTWVLAAGVLGVAWRVFNDEGYAWVSPLGFLVVGGVLALAAATSLAPGIMGSILVLALGFYRKNRILIALGMIALAGFVIYFYYNLAYTLLTKSLLLMATGAVMLGLRYGLSRIANGEEVAS